MLCIYNYLISCLQICGYSSSKLRGQLPRISPHKTLETLRWMAPEVCIKPFPHIRHPQYLMTSM